VEADLVVDTTIIIFEIINFGQKISILDRHKKKPQSFWTSCFELVHCD
jgi:hypothetical protein